MKAKDFSIKSLKTAIRGPKVKAHKVELGDILYTPLYGVWRHYGIVVRHCPEGDHIVRSVNRNSKVPVDLLFSDFSAGKNVFLIPYPDKVSRQEAVANAMETLHFDYNLFINNCEHFIRKSHGMSPVSYQVVAGLALIAGSVALGLIRRRFPGI